MINLEDICKNLSLNKEVLGAFILDSITGKPLSKNIIDDYITDDYIDSLSKIYINTFNQNYIDKIENLFSKNKNNLKEIFFKSNEILYFIRIIEEKKLAIIIISRKNANQGIIWSSIKKAITEIVNDKVD